MSFAVERDDRSAEYFDATAEGILLISRCPACGTAYPPGARKCGDGDVLVAEAASGAATLVTWAVEHAPPLATELAAPDGLSSVFGMVELAEGPWLQVPIVGTDPARLEEGMPMVLRFVRPGGGESIPAFSAE